ncbi:MAG: acetate--CoA ligase family protein [Spongiibacteraceae bacterium]
MNSKISIGASALNKLFYPDAVAVLGVSKDPQKLGTRTLLNVVNGGFAGGIFPIGRDLDEMAGLCGYASIADVPQAPDVVFMALPADRTAAAVRDCAMAGVKFAIIGASGFAELDNEEGNARQAELDAIVRETGIRLIGPNCNGIYCTAAKLAIGFNTGHSRQLAPGNIAVLSHSGALFDPMMQLMMPLGGAISTFVSAGNQGDLDVLDYMEYLLEDNATRVIALLLDSLGDGERFRTLALRARAGGKAVIALKIGTSEVGARAATAHSSRLAGSEAAYRALFTASGVATATSLEGFIAGAVLLARFGLIEGGLASISTSGAGGSLIADIATRHQVAIPAYAKSTLVALSEFQRYENVSNPTDIGVFGGLQHMSGITRAIAGDPDIGVLLLQVHRLSHAHIEQFARSLVGLHADIGTAAIALVPGDLAAEDRALFTAQGILLFTDTETCLQGIAALLTPPPSTLPSARADAPTTMPVASGALSEPDSLALLASFGVNSVPVVRCHSADAATAAARQLGLPVVLKGVADGVAHKSELGLVKLNLQTEEAVREAFIAVATTEVIVQPMIRGTAEAIIGVSRTPDIGPLLLAGLGGIFTEALRDIVTWALPVDRAALERGLDQCALGRLLNSERWSGAKARAELIESLLRLQEFALAAGPALEAVDVNPMILSDNGAIAADALVVFSDNAGGSAS